MHCSSKMNSMIVSKSSSSNIELWFHRFLVKYELLPSWSFFPRCHKPVVLDAYMCSQDYYLDWCMDWKELHFKVYIFSK